MRNSCCLLRKVRKFSSLQILQSGCNPRHLNSRAFLDCSGLHLDYMDYMVIKWIAEQCNPKQSKGNLCNPSAIHCNLGLQFCFAIQINLCNLTAIQEDCSLIAEIALWLWRLHTDCWDCSMIAEIAHWLLRLQRFRNLHIRLVIPPHVGEVAWELPQGNGTRMIEWVRMHGVLSDSWYFALIAKICIDVICYSEVFILFCSGLVATLGRLVRVLSQYHIDI